MIFRNDRPTVRKLADIAFACIDHRLDRKSHPGSELHAGARFAVMQYLRIFMKISPDAMAAKFAHNTETVALRVALNDMADVA